MFFSALYNVVNAKASILIYIYIVTVVKKCLEEPYTVSYASGRLENVRIHDIEFLDSQELGLVVESIKGKGNDLIIVCTSLNMSFFS